VNVLSEEDSIDVRLDDVHIPSVFSVKKTEPEVRLCFHMISVLLICVCLCLCAHTVCNTCTYVCFCSVL
jgi:hypothetical protein